MNALKSRVVSSKNKLVKQWLVFAEEDLVWAESSLKEGIWRGACFACQQYFGGFNEAAVILTPYVGTTRYPDLGNLEFSSEQANQALKFTKQLKDFIEEIPDILKN